MGASLAKFFRKENHTSKTSTGSLPATPCLVAAGVPPGGKQESQSGYAAREPHAEREDYFAKPPP